MKTKILISTLVLTLILVMGCSETEEGFGPGAAILQYYVGETLLIAGQNEVVGTVTIDYEGGNLAVTYEITVGDWEISETHLWVGASLATLPTNKKGNPQIGLYPYSMDHDPTVTEYTYNIPSPVGVGEVLYISAHAVVQDPSGTGTLEVCSDGDETYVAYSGPGTVGNPNPNPYGPGNSRAGTTVAAWQHPWWINYVNPTFATTSATWIWESYRPFGADSIYGTVCDITEGFDIPGPVAGPAMLMVTTDNAYEAYVNANMVGSDGTGAGWRTSDLTEPFVSTVFDVWSTVESYDVSAYLQEGSNTLLFQCANEYFMPPDYLNTEPGTVILNPGALIYCLQVDYGEMMDETAWGDGGQILEGGSWAMYFTFEIPPEP
jgi:hypothetical protein